MRLVLIPLLSLLAAAHPALATPGLACTQAGKSTAAVWARGDFDGDSHVDLARVTLGRGDAGLKAYPNARVDLLRRCSGSPILVRSLAPAIEAELRVRDVDRDNDLDLIIGNPDTRQTIDLWINDGSGAFTRGDPASVPAAADPFSVERAPGKARASVAARAPRGCPGIAGASTNCHALATLSLVPRTVIAVRRSTTLTSQRGRAPPASGRSLSK